ncbi:Vacuolar protein sorting-associated protein 35 [Geodia barretti]|uniref:Vacuolar protein sorting-associated protein 35 n=1 Tax=Geodia barretti TaxID=519541 RepID=A0AA35XI47_GEOBA|nr:Vacuolar protein sorting-associated protein 35 [Geodia barretti]
MLEKPGVREGGEVESKSVPTATNAAYGVVSHDQSSSGDVAMYEISQCKVVKLTCVCAMSSSRLLKNPDQCHSVATCAHVHCPSKDREVTEGRAAMPLEDVVALYASLVNLALKCYPNRLDYVDTALLCTVEVFTKREATPVESSSVTSRELIRLQNVPVKTYESTLDILKLDNFPKALELHDYQGRKSLAVSVVGTVVSKSISIPTADEADALFKLLSPLVKDQADQPAEPPDPDDFEEEQMMMACLVDLFRAPEPDQQYMILNVARKHFGTGGDKRIRFTLPPLVFAAYKLISQYHSLREQDDRWLMKCEQIFKFCFQTINALVKNQPELSLRLFLQGSMVADRISNETVTYEFFSQAFTLYEEEVTDSRAQQAAITLIIATLEQLSSLGEENHETLRSNCAMSSSRLLKKPDQCRSVATCAHVFWSGHFTSEDREVTECKDPKRVLECLKKAGRIAQQCMDTSVQALPVIKGLLDKAARPVSRS